MVIIVITSSWSNNIFWTNIMISWLSSINVIVIFHRTKKEQTINSCDLLFSHSSFIVALFIAHFDFRGVTWLLIRSFILCAAACRGHVCDPIQSEYGWISCCDGSRQIVRCVISAPNVSKCQVPSDDEKRYSTMFKIKKHNGIVFWIKILLNLMGMYQSLCFRK